MRTKRIVFIVFAILFAILTLVFYFLSIREVDRDAARYLGISVVANMQTTVFAAACAVMCCINVASAVILSALENDISPRPGQSYVPLTSSSDPIASINKPSLKPLESVKGPVTDPVPEAEWKKTARALHADDGWIQCEQCARIQRNGRAVCIRCGADLIYDPKTAD